MKKIFALLVTILISTTAFARAIPTCQTKGEKQAIVLIAAQAILDINSKAHYGVDASGIADAAELRGDTFQQNRDESYTVTGAINGYDHIVTVKLDKYCGVESIRSILYSDL